MVLPEDAEQIDGEEKGVAHAWMDSEGDPRACQVTTESARL